MTLTPTVSLGEEFNDNIFFSSPKFAEYVTRLRLGVNVAYQTQYSNTQIFLGTGAAYLARQSNTTVNLAEAQGGTLATSYQFSPDLTFFIADRLARVGSTRDIGFITGNTNSLPPPQQESDPSDSNPGNINILLPAGSAFTNSLGITAHYAFDPRWSTSLTYSNGISDFTDPNSLTLTQRGSVQLGYQLTPSASVGGSLGYSRFNSNTSPDSESISVALGGTYQISDNWSTYGSAGASLNHPLEPGGGSTRTTGTFAIGLNRQFERAFVTIGAQQGVTPTAGLAGASNTLGGYLSGQLQITEYLVGNLGASYSRFDAFQADFTVFRLRTGFGYPLSQNWTAGLYYGYRRFDTQQALADVSQPGVIDQNAVFIQVTWSEPWWQFDL